MCVTKVVRCLTSVPSRNVSRGTRCTSVDQRVRRKPRTVATCAMDVFGKNKRCSDGVKNIVWARHVYPNAANNTD